MIKTIERKITPKQIAWLYVKNTFYRPFIIVLNVILKICGLYIILYNIFGESGDLWYGILFIIFFEILLIILYFRFKSYYKSILGEEAISKYELHEDRLIYSVGHSTTTIFWEEITYVKLRKNYILVKKGKATVLKVFKSSEYIENFNTIKDYINHVSYNYTFGSDTK